MAEIPRPPGSLGGELLPARPVYEGPLAKETINKEANAIWDAMDPETQSETGRLHSLLPVFYKDIERVPEIANAAAKGLVEGATAGMVRLPDLKDETTPMFLFRTMGYMLGAAAPISAASKLLGGTRLVHGVAKAAPLLAQTASRTSTYGLTKVGRAAVGSTVGGIQSGIETQGDPVAIVLGTALGSLNAFAGSRAVAKRRSAILAREAFVPIGGGEIAPPGIHPVNRTRLRGDEIQLAQLESEQAFAERLAKEKLRPGTEEYIARWRREFDYDVQDPEAIDVVEGLAKRARAGEDIGSNMAVASEDVPAMLRSPKGLAPKQADKLDDIESIALDGDPEELIEDAVRELRAEPELPRATANTIARPPGTEPGLMAGQSKPSAIADIRASGRVGKYRVQPVEDPIEVPTGQPRTHAATGKRREPVIVTRTGQVLTESQALNRRGKPARRKSIEDVDVFQEPLDPNTSKFRYFDKKTKSQIGSSTWARLSRVEGGAADPTGRVIPVRLGDNPEFMITELNMAPGYSDAILIDLRGRGARFIQPTRPGIKGLATRFGGRKIKDAEDVVEFDPIPRPVRGGAPGFPTEQLDELVASAKGKRFRASSLRPPKFVFGDLEKATGIPLYSRVFKGVEHVRNKARIEGAGLGNAIADAFGFARRKQRVQMLDDLIAGKPIQNAKLQNIIDKAIDPMFKDWLGMDFATYAQTILPAVRQTKTTSQVANLLPGNSLAGLIKHTEKGRLNLMETDLARVLNQHIHTALYDLRMDGTYKAVERLIKSPKFPTELRDYVATYLRGAEGTESRFVHTMGPIYKRIWGYLGHEVLESESRNLIQTFSTLAHIGLLGFKPGAVIRGLMNGIQTGSRLGSKWTLEGTRQAFTKEGQALFRASGIPQEAQVLTDALQEMASSPVSRGLNKVTKLSLGPYSAADKLPRAQMYLGGRAKFLSRTEKLATNVSDDVLFTETGLWRMHPIIRDEVAKVFRTGNREGAAKLFGMHMQQDTQWMYRSGSKPLALQTDMGKALGTFGIWPANFIEYTRQMATLPMPGIERAKWVAEHLAMNGAIVLAFGGAGSTVGLGYEAMRHTTGWTFAGPLSYGGGPLLEIMPAAAHAAHELLKFPPKPGRGVSNLVQESLSVVPFSGIASTIQRSKGKTLYGKPSPKYAKPRSIEEQFFRTLTDVQREK